MNKIEYCETNLLPVLEQNPPMLLGLPANILLSIPILKPVFEIASYPFRFFPVHFLDIKFQKLYRLCPHCPSSPEGSVRPTHDKTFIIDSTGIELQQVDMDEQWPWARSNFWILDPPEALGGETIVINGVKLYHRRSYHIIRVSMLLVPNCNDLLADVVDRLIRHLCCGEESFFVTFPRTSLRE